MQAYTPSLSLWHLVEQQVTLHEQEEIKNMLGASLVDQSIELHEEVDMLLEIWREMKVDESEFSPGFSPGLPEPPNQRERLVQEICFFVENVKEKAKEKGVDPNYILKQHSEDVLDYAMYQSRPGSSAGCTYCSSDGRETPLMVASPDRLNASNEMINELEAANEQLNYLDFDHVCLNLRATIVKEIEQLIKDIHFLQTCLDTEADIRDCVTPRGISQQPTLTELREERSSLVKELLAAEGLTSSPTVHKPLFNTSIRILPCTPPGSVESPPLAQATPLKANHNILSEGSHDRAAIFSTRLRSVLKAEGKKPLSAPSSPQGSQSEGNLHRPLGQTTGSTHVKLSGRTTDYRALIEYASSGQHRNEREHSGRRVSPGRVQVVDVTNTVGTHLSRGNSSAKAHVDMPLSTPPAAFTPSSPKVERDRTLQPGSAHADQFRKMVIGCRDGQ